jgi:hypothetical protein
VVVVGFGTDDEGRDFWLVKNSWGTHWGEQGFFKCALAHPKETHSGLSWPLPSQSCVLAMLCRGHGVHQALTCFCSSGRFVTKSLHCPCCLIRPAPDAVAKHRAPRNIEKPLGAWGLLTQPGYPIKVGVNSERDPIRTDTWAAPAALAAATS